MNFKNFKKNIILAITIFSCIMSQCVFASSKNYYEIEKVTYDTMGEPFTSNYASFLNNIGISDYQVVNAGWQRIRPYNDKLIIGASAVVFCGDTLKDEIDNYGYDIIGYGGISDDKIKEWIPHINKKYKKIILYEGVNTLNIATLNSFDTVINETVESTLTTIVDLCSNLLEPSGEFSYVKVLPMVYGQDSNDQNFVKRFNKLADEYNSFLANLGINLYEVKYPTTNEYSAGYIHFNNNVVWKSILQ